MIISLDTECTGLDWAHGAAPFLVTSCDQDGLIRYWEWDVDPLTRRPEIPADDLADIAELLDSADIIYLHNAKFDAHMLRVIGLELPWPKVRDTLVAGHLLGSNHDHHLDKMVEEYLLAYISKYEKTIEKTVRTCRDIVRREYPSWRIADEGVPGMPSVSVGSTRDEDKPWKADMWLPRALARVIGKVSLFRLSENSQVPNDNWQTACSRYANADSEHTLYLGLELWRRICEAQLWAIYEHRMQLPRVVYDMEVYGVTTIGEFTESTIQEYQLYVAEAADNLRSIASEYGHDLQLAEGASLNDNMRDFFYGARVSECLRCGYKKRIKHWNGERDPDDGEVCPKCFKGGRKPKARGVSHPLAIAQHRNLGLPVITNKKTGNASLDKEAMQEYLNTLEGTPLEFIQILMDKRRHDTDLTYMEAYRRFWVDIPCAPGYHRIHPSINPCGTDHLRMSSNSPNLQNVGKQEDDTRSSVRNCFGPAPGREWWSMDFQNIELRIPAYESGEPKMIEIFERGEVEPYWGSYHNLIASIVYPDEYFASDLHLIKDGFKKKYKATLYQWIKNFNFAKQYGCGKRKGDATARKRGAFDLVDTGLPMLAQLQAKYMRDAERNGYVETLPDKTVDAARGYPILAGRTDDNRVLSTTPFNYHVSGTACWCKNTALIRCAAQIVEWRKEGFDAYIALEIHDEILFDFPRGKDMQENLPRARVLQKLMEQSGDNLIPRIPTPVSVEYHPVTWAVGVSP